MRRQMRKDVGLRTSTIWISELPIFGDPGRETESRIRLYFWFRLATTRMAEGLKT